jgi:signal-transduction protein with cAMP-binding, CBS, and nucleotidyltransferase domain
MMALGLVRAVILGDLFGGLWTILIGLFLVQAASAARQDRTMRDGLEGVPVGSVMDITVPAVEQSTSIQQFVYEYLLRSQRRRFVAVHGADHTPTGIVDASAANRVAREQWATTPVSTIVTPVLFTVTPELDAAELLTRLQDRADLIPVTVDGRVVGAVDLMRLLQVAQMRRELRIQLRPSTV